MTPTLTHPTGHIIQAGEPPDITAGQQAPDLLSEDVHGDAEQTDADLDAGDDVEGLDDAVAQDPLVGGPGQGEAEHVLEDQQAGEGFDRDVTYSRVSRMIRGNRGS